MGAAEADGLADTQVMDEDQASVAKAMRAERPSRSPAWMARAERMRAIRETWEH